MITVTNLGISGLFTIIIQDSSSVWSRQLSVTSQGRLPARNKSKRKWEIKLRTRGVGSWFLLFTPAGRPTGMRPAVLVGGNISLAQPPPPPTPPLPPRPTRRSGYRRARARALAITANVNLKRTPPTPALRGATRRSRRRV